VRSIDGSKRLRNLCVLLIFLMVDIAPLPPPLINTCIISLPSINACVRGIHTYARRGEPRLAYGERGEAKFASLRLALPRACVYGVASTSGATAIQNYKTVER